MSDFGLNDAIESGLVKTPRVVVRDDGVPNAKDYRSKLYHIYQHVRDDLNRKAEPQDRLPDLVLGAYHLLAKDWLETARRWDEQARDTPPVLITVANRTETAARVKHAFDRGQILIQELCDPSRTLHIDSRVLEKAEAQIEDLGSDGADGDLPEDDEGGRPKLTKDEQAELLRLKVDTVGVKGRPGELVQNVISVGMLSEGWDAKTVTQIMGLRAFSSQLLCEQVVGRGLRRTSYELNADGLLDAEYVNIFGVPFTFLPHEGGQDVVPPPPPPKSKIEAMAEKAAFEIIWPNVVRIEHVLAPRLTLDLERVAPIEVNAAQTPTLAKMAPIVEGKPDVKRISEIDLEDLSRRFRMQRVVFETAAAVYEQMRPGWTGSKERLLAQVVTQVERFLSSDRVAIVPAVFAEDDRRRRILLALNMTRLVNHIWQALRFDNAVGLTPVFDTENPIRQTGHMLPWYTGRPWELTERSHINRCVFDSTWEASEASVLDRSKIVSAWAKNDHLGFEVLYVHDGVVRKYRPDFLIRLSGGRMLVLEVKGQDSPQTDAKHRALDEWTRAVTAHGGFGEWKWGIARKPAEVSDVLARASRATTQRV